MSDETFVRDLLARALEWEDAHAGFDAAVKDFPEELRGRQAAASPHSPWQLVEHLRLTQRDILEFCVNPDYAELKWPDDYWPASAAPPDRRAWDESVRGYREDRAALQQLARNTAIDLAAQIPHGSGQTYGREIVLVIDHTAYHVGQLILVRRALGAWN
jgi:hypothetical protein